MTQINFRIDNAIKKNAEHEQVKQNYFKTALPTFIKISSAV